MYRITRPQPVRQRAAVSRSPRLTSTSVTVSNTSATDSRSTSSGWRLVAQCSSVCSNHDATTCHSPAPNDVKYDVNARDSCSSTSSFIAADVSRYKLTNDHARPPQSPRCSAWTCAAAHRRQVRQRSTRRPGLSTRHQLHRRLVHRNASGQRAAMLTSPPSPLPARRRGDAGHPITGPHADPKACGYVLVSSGA